MNDHISMYSREREAGLSWADVWDNSFWNLLCPEFFYHAYFTGLIYSLETEVTILTSVDHKLPLRKRPSES